MSMKNVMLTMVVLGMVSIPANAVVLAPNGTFDADAAEWNADGGGIWTAGHRTTGGNPGGYVTLQSTEWAVWFPATYSFFFDELGVPAGTTVTVSADMKNDAVLASNPALKAESWDSVVGWPGGQKNSSGDVPFAATTSWVTYSFDFATHPDADAMKIVLIAAYAGGGATGFDNVGIEIPGGTPALWPAPIVGGDNYAGNDILSWINPDPNNPADTITADVYILESETLLSDPNIGPIITDPGVVQVADDTTAEMVDLSGAGYTLTADKYYYWAVHITDPEIGTVAGYDWYFLATADAPPTVNAGPDQYLVTAGSPMVLNLDATVTDDGSHTITWADLTNAADKDPDTTVTINSPGTDDTTVTLTNPVSGVVTGYYIFEITVDDGANPAVTDQVIVNVLGTCGEAADADPDDTYDITGDLNLDCKKDMADLAIFAAGWLDCNTNRPDDVTCP